MKTHDFFRQYEDTEKNSRFQMIKTPSEPISLFVIFKQLADVRAQQRYFAEREAHLLKLAEIGFKQLRGNNGDSKTT